jgi:hypothetical protein
MTLCASTNFELLDNTTLSPQQPQNDMLITGSNMALPVIKSLSDCADFSKTVEPYLPQLYTFAHDVAASITNADTLKQL